VKFGALKLAVDLEMAIDLRAREVWRIEIGRRCGNGRRSGTGRRFESYTYISCKLIATDHWSNGALVRKATKYRRR